MYIDICNLILIVWIKLKLVDISIPESANEQVQLSTFIYSCITVTIEYCTEAISL